MFRSTLLAAAYAMCALAGASTLGAQRVIPVHEEPRHKLVYEGGGLRVLDVQIAPGDTSLYHLHATPILYTNISPSRTIEQLVGGDWPPPGTPPILRWVAGGTLSDTIYTVRPKAHRVTNIGDRLFRLIGVVTMDGTPRPFTTAIESEMPGVREMTSSWFRQTRVTLTPADSTAWLRTSRTMVAILPFDGHMLIEREGSETTGLSMPGAFSVIKAGERYRVRNPSRATTPVVLVQPH
jgi:hypothetical protein